MPTLYVENVPKDLYEALRNQAKSRRRSIAAEVLALLEQAVPTEKELKARREFYKLVQSIRLRKRRVKDLLPSAEEMIREDRDR